MDLIYKEESYQIIGSCFEVYNELGCGFDETVYHEALKIELSAKDIPFQTELGIAVKYKGIELAKSFRADLVCYEKVIVELKAVKSLNDFHRQQVINYLKATGYKLGLLVNFGAPEGVVYERVVY